MGPAVLLMKLVAVRSELAYGTLGKLLFLVATLTNICHYYRLLIVVFAIFVCICIGCCRKCYCKQNRNYSSREINVTVASNTGAEEYFEQSPSSSNYNKPHVDAPPSYFDVAPNYMQEDDLPPPYPGVNNNT